MIIKTRRKGYTQLVNLYEKTLHRQLRETDKKIINIGKTGKYFRKIKIFQQTGYVMFIKEGLDNKQMTETKQKTVCFHKKLTIFHFILHRYKRKYRRPKGQNQMFRGGKDGGITCTSEDLKVQQ